MISSRWWLEEVQRRTYPSLSQFAIDILSIPAMQAEPERVFSGCVPAYHNVAENEIVYDG